MGVIATARRTGVARGLLLHLLEEARARRDRMMVLEVIEQNPAACALYRREGFRKMGRFMRLASSGAGRRAGNFRHVRRARGNFDGGRQPARGRTGIPELPWAICRHAIARMISGRAYLSGRAVVVIGDPAVAGPVRIHALAAVAPNEPDWAEMRKASAGVLGLHHGREFFAPPVFPEEFGTKLFAPLGFAREPLSQFLMRRDL